MATRIDGRKIKRGELARIRIEAIKRVREGETVAEVMRSYSLSRTNYYRWLSDYKQGGFNNLKAKKNRGFQPKVSSSKHSAIVQLIDKKDPRDYGYAEALWSIKIIQELLEKKELVKLCRRSVGNLLHRIGLSCQRPLKRAYERNEKEIINWVHVKYPKIVKSAKRRGAEIFFLDESGFESDSNLGRTWGKKGQTPIVKISGQRQKTNAISMVCPQGKFWFATYNQKFNSEFFISQLKLFLKSRKRKTVLIMDCHPVHKSKLVAKFIQEQKGRLTIEFLPPHAPDLNPDEFVWKDVKEIHKKIPLSKNASLEQSVINCLSRIKKSKTKIKSFFMAKSVAYSIA